MTLDNILLLSTTSPPSVSQQQFSIHETFRCNFSLLCINRHKSHIVPNNLLYGDSSSFNVRICWRWRHLKKPSCATCGTRDTGEWLFNRSVNSAVCQIWQWDMKTCRPCQRALYDAHDSIYLTYCRLSIPRWQPTPHRLHTKSYSSKSIGSEVHNPKPNYTAQIVSYIAKLECCRCLNRYNFMHSVKRVKCVD